MRRHELRGGSVDDVLKRLSSLEIQVSSIAATIPHLATAASVAEILAVIPHLATKADLKNEIAGVRTEIGQVRSEIGEVRTEIAEVKVGIASMEARISKWFIATSLASVGLAFTLAKLIH
jgi:septal ring factor EnvC (AmiA/AmiB activator)